MKRVMFLVMAIAFCGMIALAGVTKPHKQMLFVRDFDTKDKDPLYDTQVYITQPTSMVPNTSYTFDFKVDFWSMELEEYLLSLSITFPAGYTNITATDPPPADETEYGSHWTHTISGTTVTWTFAHYCDPESGWGCGWGDAHVGSSITFSATAKTDAAATNRFQYTVTGDFNNTLSGTAYVGGPRITSTSPVWFDTATPDEDIVLQFSEPINSATLEFSTDPSVGGWEGSWNGDKTQVTLSHDDFPKNTSVLLNIPEYKDTSGIAGTPRTILFFIPPDPIQSAFTYTLPVADGFIAEGEWDDATSVDISVQGTDKAILYLKNDAQKLYVGLDVPADTKLSYVQIMGMPLAADQAIFTFDENNDDTYPLEDKTSGEGTYWAVYAPDVNPPLLIDFLGRYGNWIDGNYSTDDEYVETRAGIDPFISATAGHVAYELFFDFEESYLNPPEFPATIGVTFLIYSAEGNPFNYYYLLLGRAPNEFFSGNPATFLDVRLSAGPAPEVTSIDPNWGSPRTINPVSIYGMNFANGCTALLRRDEDDTELLDIHYVHAAEVDGKVPTFLADGYYDVVVRNPDGAEGVLEDGYYVGESPPSDDDDDDDDGGKTKGIGGCGCSF